MADEHARQELLDLLDKKAFNPVLNASEDDYNNESMKRKLRDVQGTTKSTKKRYHENYTTAADVRDNFKDDLSSDAAQSVQRDLRDLGLPTLDDVKDEFERRADELGVGH